jgi:hypothetical protein
MTARKNNKETTGNNLPNLSAQTNEMIDDDYPPESAIKPEFIKSVLRASAEIKQGKGIIYDSMEDFIRHLEE